jgi:3-phenylpropionate/trans-cinnamate dioxygenase ferredoxin reductase component
MSSIETVAIVGAGLAGVTAAGALREHGHAGRIVLVGEEPELPYDRPPLSKSVLVHDDLEKLVATRLPGDIALRSPQEIALRPQAWYTERQIELMLGQRAVRLDTTRHELEVAGGGVLRYDRLLLATGARARRLPALEQGQVPHLYLRTLHDALELRERLSPGQRIVLIGGGVIGMEVAASAVLRGCEVTVIELAPRIMARALCPEISEHLARYHRARGVRLLLSAQLRGQATGDVRGIELADGSIVSADLLLIGIGVLPETALAEQAGLHCEDGIVVDAHGATSTPDVYAAGDAVRYPDSFLGRSIRSENWMHAQNQAAAVAQCMLGATEPYAQVPHMWSDQYDLKIQVTGTCDGKDPVCRGNVADNRFMLIYLDGPRIQGATGINEARDMKFVQKLIEARTEVGRVELADPAFNLKKAAAR